MNLFLFCWNKNKVILFIYFFFIQGSATFCSLAGNISARVNNLRASKVDVIKHDWASRCLENAKLMPLLPDDFISMSEHTDAIVTTFFDTYRNNAEGLPTYDFICEVVKNFENFMVMLVLYYNFFPFLYFIFTHTTVRENYLVEYICLDYIISLVILFIIH